MHVSRGLRRASAICDGCRAAEKLACIPEHGSLLVQECRTLQGQVPRWCGFRATRGEAAAQGVLKALRRASEPQAS